MNNKQREAKYVCKGLQIDSIPEKKIFGLKIRDEKWFTRHCGGLIQAIVGVMRCDCPQCEFPHQVVRYICQECNHPTDYEYYTQKINIEKLNKKLKKLWEQNKGEE